jgi:predicted metal-binding membrane protein
MNQPGPEPSRDAGSVRMRTGERIYLLSAIALISLLCWAYLLAGAGMQMGMRADWDAAYAGLMFMMWWLMMVAMMLPSAAPMIMMFAKISRRPEHGALPALPVVLFTLAYAVAWAVFSVVAVALQWGLEASGLISPMLKSTSGVLSGAILVAAGLYQLTPLKHMCLRHCRSPLQFVLGRWRNGLGGAWRMGLEHGAYCVGCCWFLMALLFVGGVMNIYWIAGLTLLVLVEKTIPVGRWFGQALGLGLTAWGVWLLAGF